MGAAAEGAAAEGDEGKAEGAGAGAARADRAPSPRTVQLPHTPDSIGPSTNHRYHPRNTTPSLSPPPQ